MFLIIPINARYTILLNTIWKSSKRKEKKYLTNYLFLLYVRYWDCDSFTIEWFHMFCRHLDNYIIFACWRTQKNLRLLYTMPAVKMCVIKKWSYVMLKPILYKNQFCSITFFSFYCNNIYWRHIFVFLTFCHTQLQNRYNILCISICLFVSSLFGICQNTFESVEPFGVHLCITIMVYNCVYV